MINEINGPLGIMYEDGEDVYTIEELIEKYGEDIIEILDIK